MLRSIKSVFSFGRTLSSPTFPRLVKKFLLPLPHPTHTPHLVNARKKRQTDRQTTRQPSTMKNILLIQNLARISNTYIFYSPFFNPLSPPSGTYSQSIPA